MDSTASEASRRSALAELGPLEDLYTSEGPDPHSFDELAALAAELTGMSMAAVTVMADDRLVFVGAAGLQRRQTGPELSFCAVAVQTPDEPLLVPDALADERFATYAAVVNEPHVRSYSGVPLVTSDGVVLGAFCVLDQRPHQLTDAQLRTLASLAHLATELLEARRAANRLATANAQLLQAEAARQSARYQFETVFDNVPLGMTLADAQGDYLRVNSTFGRMLGLPVAQVVGQSFARFTANGIDDDVRAIGDLINRDADSSVREKTYQRTDGSTFPALVTTFVIHPADDSGSCLLLNQVESLAERRAAEASLLEVQSAVDGIITVNGAGRITSWNLGAERLLGYPAHSVLGRTPDDLLQHHARRDPGYWAARLTSDATQALIGGRTEVSLVRADGQRLLVELSLSRWEQAGSPRYTAVLRDITARRHTEALINLVAQAAHISNEAESLADAAPAVIAAVCSLLGGLAGHAWTGDDAEATWHVADHRHPTGQPCAMEDLAAVGSRPTTAQLPFDPQTRVAPDRASLDGSGIEEALVTCDIGSAVAVPVLAGTDTAGILAFYLPTGASPPDSESTAAMEQVGVVLGRVVERERASALIRHQAGHDPLTDLANRRTLFEHIAATQTGLADGRHSGTHALLLLDLDRFKLVNDSLGYVAGDTMLQGVADRISACVGPGDLAARLGGDEFAVLTHDHPDDDSVLAYAQQVLAALTGTIEVAKHAIPLHSSLGVCTITPGHGSVAHDPEAVLRDADAALRLAKRRGKGRLEFLDDALRADAAQRLRDETDLEEAITTEAFTLHYQPILDLNTGEPAGAEALVRWQRPGRGLVLPGCFIPLAEEAGLIIELGRWVLRQACADAAQWSRTVPALVKAPVSVNVSARQLIHPRFSQDVDEALHDARLPADRLILEVTESFLIEETESTIAILTDLRARGIRVALDDFGTGYSSLSYLQRIPVDILKIDKSFIDAIRGTTGGTALSEVVLKLAQALDLRTVAEGVEATDQLIALRQLGCDWAQGFVLAHPVPIADLQTACEAAILACPRTLSASAAPATRMEPGTETPAR